MPGFCYNKGLFIQKYLSDQGSVMVFYVFNNLSVPDLKKNTLGLVVVITCLGDRVTQRFGNNPFATGNNVGQLDGNRYFKTVPDIFYEFSECFHAFLCSGKGIISSPAPECRI